MLSDGEKRAAYNQFGHAGVEGHGGIGGRAGAGGLGARAAAAANASAEASSPLRGYRDRARPLMPALKRGLRARLSV